MSPGGKQRSEVAAADAPAAVGPYSQAIRFGDLLFCSGQIPIDPATGELVEGTVGQQAERCLGNLEAVCREAGTSLDHALRMSVYTTRLDQFPEINEVWANRFRSGAQPARAALGVDRLPLGAEVEIDAIVACDV